MTEDRHHREGTSGSEAEQCLSPDSRLSEVCGVGGNRVQQSGVAFRGPQGRVGAELT